MAGMSSVKGRQEGRFGDITIKDVCLMCGDRFDPDAKGSRVNGTIVVFVDERTITDGTVVIAEGAEEWVRKPGSASIVDHETRTFTWRWVRVHGKEIAEWVSRVQHKALITFMTKKGITEHGFNMDLVANGDLIEAD